MLNLEHNEHLGFSFIPSRSAVVHFNFTKNLISEDLFVSAQGILIERCFLLLPLLDFHYGLYLPKQSYSFIISRSMFVSELTFVRCAFNMYIPHTLGILGRVLRFYCKRSQLLSQNCCCISRNFNQSQLSFKNVSFAFMCGPNEQYLYFVLKRS